MIQARRINVVGTSGGRNFNFARQLSEVFSADTVAVILR